MQAELLSKSTAEAKSFTVVRIYNMSTVFAGPLNICDTRPPSTVCSWGYLWQASGARSSLWAAESLLSTSEVKLILRPSKCGMRDQSGTWCVVTTIRTRTAAEGDNQNRMDLISSKEVKVSPFRWGNWVDIFELICINLRWSCQVNLPSDGQDLREEGGVECASKCGAKCRG